MEKNKAKMEHLYKTISEKNVEIDSLKGTIKILREHVDRLRLKNLKLIDENECLTKMIINSMS